MKRIVLYGSLIIGLVLITLPAFSQSLLPGVQTSDIKMWIVTFGVGALFTVLWYIVKRWIELIDNLNRSVQSLTTETKMHRQESRGATQEIKILKKRANIVSNWIHQHDNTHAKCPQCPDSYQTFNEVINDTDI